MNPRFFALLLGQTGALLGAGLTGFALGVWVLQETGSAQRFAWIATATTLPGVVLAPLAGGLAERFAPRDVLLLANGLALVATAILLVLTGDAIGWPIYAVLVLSGAGFGLQWPAYAKATTALVAAPAQARAAGLLQLGPVAQHVAAPAIAALLLAFLGTHGVLALDAGLLALALATSLLVAGRVGRTPHAGGGLREAWAFLRARPGLLSLQFFYAASYFFGAVLLALGMPLLLLWVGERQAGVLLTISGAGMLAGVAVVAALRWRWPRVASILALEALGGACLLLIGVAGEPHAMTVLAAVFLAQMSISNGLSHALWQEAVPLPLQVRVFALRRMLAWMSFPMCFLVAGPVADALAVALDDRVRAIELVFIAAGAGKIAVSLAYSRARLRALDEPVAPRQSPQRAISPVT